MQHWKLEPEVAAELGDHSELDTSEHPPVVSRLHLRFTGWLGDDLIECFPCFVVTDALGRALDEAKLSGYRLASLEVTRGDEMAELQPEIELPEFKWLVLENAPGADLRTDAQHNLVVTERAMKVLRRFRLDQCDIERAAPP